MVKWNFRKNWRKPVFWISLLCTVGIITAAVFLLSDFRTVFEKHASMIGLEQGVYLEKLGIEEESVIRGTGGDFLTGVGEHNGLTWHIIRTYSEVTGNRVISVEFVADPVESFDEMAEAYLQLQELMIRLYGTAEVDAKSLEQLREDYEKSQSYSSQWQTETVFFMEQDEIIYIEARNFANDLVEMDYVKDSIKAMYGADAEPEPRFCVKLSCNLEEGLYFIRIYYSVTTWPDSNS